jgi:Cytochrome c554 and c-prime
MSRMPRRVGLGVLFSIIFSALGPAAAEGRRPAPPSRAEQDFLAQHWRRPLAPQGEPPTSFSPVERSLLPENCGGCHPTQFADWSLSLHSKSMGPGIAGQLAEMSHSDPAAARSCPACHAPLAEQAPDIPAPGGREPNPAFDPALRAQGLVCAGCHVRGHQRFGPPRRDGTAPDAAARATMPHGGFTPATAFLRSEFCASCHQFRPNGFALNGKLLENTFEEWRASPAARRGLQCQDCHMPARRHLWHGIHDPEMVKSGIEITLRTGRSRDRAGPLVQATLTIANTGVGHYFPTYVTPRVLARAELRDATGQPIAESAQERAIGREVPVDLSREIADTRIPPGKRFTMKYAGRLDRPGLSLRVTVTVFPDYFYTQFFEALLANGAGQGTAKIQEALEASRRSAFVLFSRDVPLT